MRRVSRVEAATTTTTTTTTSKLCASHTQQTGNSWSHPIIPTRLDRTATAVLIISTRRVESSVELTFRESFVEYYLDAVLLVLTLELVYSIRTSIRKRGVAFKQKRRQDSGLFEESRLID